MEGPREAEVDLDAGGGEGGDGGPASDPARPEADVQAFPYEITIRSVYRPTGAVTKFHLYARDVQTESRRSRVDRSAPEDAYVVYQRKDAVLTLVDARGEIVEERT